MSPLNSLAETVPYCPEMEVESEKPLPLYREPPSPDPYPVDELGPVLADAVRAIVDKTQAPEEIAAQSILAVATFTAQSHVNVQLPIDTCRPVSSFFLSIAETGERKSAVDSLALWPVRKREESLRADYDSDYAVFQNEMDAWEAQRRLIVNNKSKDSTKEDKVKALKELGPQPRPPLKPILLIGSPTFEGAVKLFAEGQPSLGMFSGEGGQFIGGHSMSDEKKLSTAAGMSELWDSGTTERVRAGDGAVKYIGRRLSMHLMAQPDVAASMLSDRALLDQGLLSRILVSAPNARTGTRLWREPKPKSDVDLKVYYARILALLERKPVKGDKSNELAPRDLAFTEEARKIWIAYANHNETLMAPGAGLSAIKGLGNKLAEHAGRIAAVLAFVNDPDAVEVDGRYMAAGAALASYYGGEALRLFHAGATDPELLIARKTSEWLRDNYRGKTIPLSEIYQKGPSAVRDAKSARRIMGTLSEHNHVEPITGGVEIEGRKTKEAWRVLEVQL